MKFQTLKPWMMGNESNTPKNFFNNLIPSFEMGAFISIDICVDLYLANTIDTGNLLDSWHQNQDYINKACSIANVGKENDYDLDNEEKMWILQKLGEPPECCYNIYFITVYNDVEERLVYIGKTDSQKSRFINGHLAALKLHNPKYKGYNKRIYFGTITFLSEHKDYIPLEFITPYTAANKYLSEFEGLLISHFKPELNVKYEQTGNMENLVIHIQNFSDTTTFLNDYFIYGC